MPDAGEREYRFGAGLEPRDQRGEVLPVPEVVRWEISDERRPRVAEAAVDRRAQPSVRRAAEIADAPPGERIAGLAAGLGVVTFTGPQGAGFFKGGHNDSTANMLVCLERGKRCVLILSNDVRSEKEIPAMVEAILGPTGLPWKWEYSQ